MLEHAGVRGVHDHQPIEQLGVADRHFPGDEAAPVVADQRDLRQAERGDDVLHVAHQLGDVVALHVGGGLGPADAARVQRDRTAVRGEPLHHAVPGPGVLGEAMQEQHRRAAALLDVVQAQTAGDNGAVRDRCRHHASLNFPYSSVVAMIRWA